MVPIPADRNSSSLAEKESLSCSHSHLRPFKSHLLTSHACLWNVGDPSSMQTGPVQTKNPAQTCWEATVLTTSSALWLFIMLTNTLKVLTRKSNIQCVSFCLASTRVNAFVENFARNILRAQISQTSGNVRVGNQQKYQSCFGWSLLMWPHPP